MKQLGLSTKPNRCCFYLVFIVLFMLGCSPEEAPFTQEETPEMGQLSTLRPTRTAMPGINTDTSTPVSTILDETTAAPFTTLTSTPPEIDTINPSATSTSVPISTISGIERQAVFADFMATNGGCDLPCWWGFELGDSLETVSQTFINLGIAPPVIGNSPNVESDRMGSRKADIADYYEDEQHGLSADVRLSVDMQFHELDDSIEYIYVFVSNVRDVPMPPEFFRDWDQYYLSSFLQRYGKPTQVYFRVRSIGDPMVSPQYSVSLLYADKGLAVTYHIKGTQDGVCLEIENVYALELSLFNPDELDIWGYQFAPYNDEGYATLTWEAEIGESLDAFYETYQEPSNLGCIQIP